MEKRVIIAVVLCLGILLVWQKLFPPPAPPPAPPQQSATDGGAARDGGVEAGTPAASLPAPGAPAAAQAQPPSTPEQTITIETPAVRFVFSSWGGALRSAELLDPQYREGKNGKQIDLVHVTGPASYQFRTAFPESGFASPGDGDWKVSRPDASSVLFTAETPAALIEKRYTVDKVRYRLHLDVVVHNRSTKAQDHHLTLSLAGWQDPDKKGGSFLSAPSANPAEMLCWVGEELKRENVEQLGKQPFRQTGAVRWIASDQKFFVLAAVPYPENPPRERLCAAHGTGIDQAEMTMGWAARAVAPGQATHYAVMAYAGPKIISELETVRPGGQVTHLDQSVNVSLAFLSRPMLALLKAFHRVVPNWGVAIILLTIFIKILTFYPNQKALISGKRMGKLAPEIAKIRKQYENDRQKQGVETMNLYKKHNVSMFGGCLPSLIQMPIWIALYSTLNYAVELYRSHFVFYVRDLTAPDPYWILPLVMGVVMFLQMKMSPTSPDSQQQKMMMWMMPIMFTGMSLLLPSGLALYMLTSYLIGIVQQLYVNYLDRQGKLDRPPAKPDRKPARA